MCVCMCVCICVCVCVQLHWFEIQILAFWNSNPGRLVLQLSPWTKPCLPFLTFPPQLELLHYSMYLTYYVSDKMGRSFGLVENAQSKLLGVDYSSMLRCQFILPPIFGGSPFLQFLLYNKLLRISSFFKTKPYNLMDTIHSKYSLSMFKSYGLRLNSLAVLSS